MIKLKHIIIVLITLFTIFIISCISNNYTYAASKTSISKAKVVFTKVPSKVYTYNGKNRKPAITIKLKGITLKKGKDYTVSYKNNKNVGKATIIIKGKGKYNKTKSVTFKIRPKETSLVSLSAKQNSIIVKYKKNTVQTKGYQIQYSTNSNFSSSKTKSINISDNTKTKTTISNLDYNKKYYIRIRTYKTVKGTKYYSKWSGKKSIITEKKADVIQEKPVEVLQEYPDYVLIEGSGVVHLSVGDTYQLLLKTTPEKVNNKSGIWTSSDESVAKVDSQGKVTGIRDGSCNISFTSENGLKATVYIQVFYTILGTKQINKVIYDNDNIKVIAKYLEYDTTDLNTKLYFDITNNTENIINLHAYKGDNHDYNSNAGMIINGEPISYDYINPCFASKVLPSDTKSSYMYMEQDSLRVLGIKQINSISFRIAIFKDLNLLKLSDLITINL